MRLPQKWFEERLHHASVGQRFAAERILVDNRDGLQQVVVIENPVFGRVLMLDGVVQTTERDEFVYHEMMAHVPILAHGAARRVLIVGGGDGGTLEEVLKHRSVERATLVEIDETVIEISRAFLGAINNGAFEDPRSEIVIADGMAFIQEARASYDVIIVDSTDPHGPAGRLFSLGFYEQCKARLAAGGIMVTQSGVPFFQPDELRIAMRRLRRAFCDVAAYTAAVPSYYGGLMTFGWATDDPSKRFASLDVLQARCAAARLQARYYTPDLHRVAFTLPRYVQDLTV